MNEIDNPFAPGAGSQPPKLVGRGLVLQKADIALGRIMKGRFQKSQLLLGLRGVGKSAVLNRIHHLARDRHYETIYIEAPYDETILDLLCSEIRRILQRLYLVGAANERALRALQALKSFAWASNVPYGDFGISVDPSPGVADSGDLALDLRDLFFQFGKAAAAAKRGVAILIDEIQYLNDAEFSALIIAQYGISLEQLPIILFGAGIPQNPVLTGEARSFAERLFDHPEIGPLTAEKSVEALREPIEREGASIDSEALVEIARVTKGYPYYIQELGFQTWNVAEASPITLADARVAEAGAQSRLDQGFYRVHVDRLTSREREYVRAMAELGPGPHRSSDVARMSKNDPPSMASFRSHLIEKGIIYSPTYGHVAFTIPMFDDFLRRAIPDFPERVPK